MESLVSWQSEWLCEGNFHKSLPNEERELKMRTFKATSAILQVSGMVAQCSNIDLTIYKHKKRLAHTYSQSWVHHHSNCKCKDIVIGNAYNLNFTTEIEQPKLFSKELSYNQYVLMCFSKCMDISVRLQRVLHNKLGRAVVLWVARRYIMSTILYPIIYIQRELRAIGKGGNTPRTIPHQLC
jgi:hypothetical protein